MKRLIPIFVVLALLAGASYFLLFNKDENLANSEVKSFKFGEFNKVRNCAMLPKFLYKANIMYPIIDLTQEKYTGIAFYYGKNFSKVLHKKSWEKYEHLGTYTIDKRGDIYLTPNPFISIKPTTFNLQKAIYKMDRETAELERWLVIDEISPSASNPYGLISITYDCDDDTLYASAIDKSDYKGSKGRIYHIKMDKSYKKVVDNFDALTLSILKGKDKKLLLAGDALTNALYAFEFENKELNPTPHKILELPNPELHIRKIRVIGKNKLKLEAIKFTYSLIAATNKKQRVIYEATYNPQENSWSVKEVK